MVPNIATIVRKFQLQFANPLNHCEESGARSSGEFITTIENVIFNYANNFTITILNKIKFPISHPLLTIVRNLAHVAQGFITTIEDAMLSFANNCATAI